MARPGSVETANRGHAAARPTPARTGSGTCSPPTTWARTSSTATSSIPRTAPSSWTNSSWLNRIEAQFTALRYFALDGTDHPIHKAQGSMIRRYIIWRNNNATDKRLATLVTRVNAA
ncbi:hypothetical protein [Micromonospora sp. KC213]|uniref:hypothetical protein n=1 Tax=Micromonospora sp. KC213 TaxID=2530378 RepID=UPI001FB6634B|nr:hypothetical protein [Micromonospora sp. KC213]